MAEIPTESFLKHLSDREGFESYVYADSLGKLTGGTGHLLTEKELAKYKKGQKIDETTTKQWLIDDSSKAYNAAIAQADEAGITDQAFIEALAEEAMYKDPDELDKGPIPKDRMSQWYQDTPVRVNDFTAALKKYGVKRDLALLKPDETVIDTVPPPPN